MPRISLGAAERGEQGQVAAFMVAAGFYPSFGNAGKIVRKFGFQNDPIFAPSIFAMGLPGKGQWSRGIGPSANELEQLHSAQQTGLFSIATQQKLDIRQTIIEDVQRRLRPFLISKAAKYTLRGNYVWWNSGAEGVDTYKLAADIYDMMVHGRTAGFGKGAQARADEMYDSFMGSFQQFEDTIAAPRTRHMIDTIVGENLSDENLLDYIEESFSGDMGDVPEEEISILKDMGLLEGTEMKDALEQLGNVNKVDVRLWKKRLDRTMEKLQMDASETLMGIADEARTGKHGWISAIEGLGKKERKFSWMRDNQEEVEKKIGDHMIKEIDDSYNPVIQDLIAYTRRSKNIPANQVPTLEQIMGETDYKGGAGLSGRPTATPGFFAGASSSFLDKAGKAGSGRIASGPAATHPEDAQEFLDEIERGHFLATQGVIQSWLNAGHKTGEAGKGQKIKGAMQYIFKMISTVQTGADHDLYQSQRLSQPDPETGFAYYGFVPMSVIHENDTPSEFGTQPYEFRNAGPRSPEYTAIFPGPNATLAIEIATGAMSVQKAKFAAAVQHNFFSTRKAHSAGIKKQADGTLLSTCDAELEKSNKHGFTITWSPKALNAFFRNFIERISSDNMSQQEIEGLADRGLQGKAKQLRVTLPIQNFNEFWALPYVGFEDNLKRKSGEAATWYNEGVEKGYSGAPPYGGRWISASGRVYTTPN